MAYFSKASKFKVDLLTAINLIQTIDCGIAYYGQEIATVRISRIEQAEADILFPVEAALAIAFFEKTLDRRNVLRYHIVNKLTIK